MAGYNAYDINQKHDAGEISDVQMVLEQASNTVSTFGGAVGAAWGVGWEVGRAITTIPFYQQWKVEVWYPWRKEKLGY